MDDVLKDQIAGVLNGFPEVHWDRLVETPVEVKVFGWIERPDGRSDFLLLDFWAITAGVPGFSTSSAELSATFAERIYGSAEEHDDCQRVEDVFGELVTQKIELPARAAP